MYLPKCISERMPSYTSSLSSLQLSCGRIQISRVSFPIFLPVLIEALTLGFMLLTSEMIEAWLELMALQTLCKSSNCLSHLSSIHQIFELGLLVDCSIQSFPSNLPVWTLGQLTFKMGETTQQTPCKFFILWAIWTSLKYESFIKL